MVQYIQTTPINLPDVELDPETGRYVSKTGLFWFRRNAEGLIVVETTDGVRCQYPAGDIVASTLCMSWQPHLSDLQEMLDESSRDEALNEARCFVRDWDLFHPGAVKDVAMRQAMGDLARDENPTPSWNHGVDGLDEMVLWSNGRWVHRFNSYSLEPEAGGTLVLALPQGGKRANTAATLPEVRRLIDMWDGMQSALELAHEDEIYGNVDLDAVRTRWDMDLGMLRQVWLQAA